MVARFTAEFVTQKMRSVLRVCRTRRRNRAFEKLTSGQVSAFLAERPGPALPSAARKTSGTCLRHLAPSETFC